MSPSKAKKPANPSTKAQKQRPAKAKTVRKRTARHDIAPQDRPLDNRERVFVAEYLIDLNAPRAAEVAGYSKSMANSKAYSWVRPGKKNPKPHVYKAVLEGMKARSERTGITPDKVLKRWWATATANASELVEYRRECCRHCHGENHKFQWIDEDEWERALAAAQTNDEEAVVSDEGGYGFNPTRRPHPECPKCFGEGHGSMFAHDTRDLSEQALLLYDGVKQTKEGLEIKMVDRSKALENVARHLGMYNDKLNLGVEPDNPLAKLIDHISGNTLQPAEDPDGGD